MTAQHTAQHILPAELIPDLLKAQQRTGTFNWKVTESLLKCFVNVATQQVYCVVSK